MVSRGIARQLLGTVIAVLAGWLTALLLLEATTAIELLQDPHYIVPDALVVALLFGGYSQSRSRFKRRLGLLHSSDHCRWCYMSDRFVDKTHVQASHLTN